MGAYAFATIHEIHYTESMSAVIQEEYLILTPWLCDTGLST